MRIIDPMKPLAPRRSIFICGTSSPVLGLDVEQNWPPGQGVAGSVQLSPMTTHMIRDEGALSFSPMSANSIAADIGESGPRMERREGRRRIGGADNATCRIGLIVEG